MKKNAFSHIGSKNRMNASYRQNKERPNLKPAPNRKPLVDPTEIIELDDDDMDMISVGLGANQNQDDVEFDATSRNSLTRAVIDKMASKTPAKT